jgi:hypothetical protein
MIDLQKIGDAVSCRAKHVNDDGQTSAEYVFDSLTTQEIPYFNLYSFNTNTRELNKLDYFAFDNDKLIKRWEYGTATETYSSMAWNPNTQLLYKISRNWVNSETMETVFEEINIKDWQIEPARRIIELTGDGYNGDTLSSTYGMTYDTANNVLILAGNAGCYQITTSGVITNLSNEPIRGLAYTDFSETPIIYCGFTNTDQLAVLDPSDGTTSGGQSITLTDYIVNSTISLCALDGTLYAILNTNQDETSKLTFVNINPSNGVATFIADFTDFAFEELTAMQKINPLDLNEYKLIARTSFFGVPENKKTVTLYVINTSGVVQNELIRFSDDRESVQNPSMTFCSADSCIYKLTTKQLPEYQSGENKHKHKKSHTNPHRWN